MVIVLLSNSFEILKILEFVFRNSVLEFICYLKFVLCDFSYHFRASGNPLTYFGRRLSTTTTFNFITYLCNSVIIEN